MRVAIITSDGRGYWPGLDPDRPSFGTAPAALFQGFARLHDVEVHVLSCTRYSLRSPERLADNIFFHSVRVPRWGEMKTMYAGCIRAVRKKLRDIQPDVVHGQGSERDCAMSAAFSGYPNVVTIHGIMRQVATAVGAAPFSFLWFAARLERIACRRTDGVVCLTKYTQEAVGPVAKRTWIVPNAADEGFFRINRRENAEATVLCVANVASYKNQNSLILALDSIAVKQRFQLVFAGALNRSSPYAEKFVELVNARPWCRYAGFASREKLMELLAEARCLVLPSLEDNCPMVLLEAMAVGVPVAASRIGGIPDLIQHGINGLLFDPQRQEEISAAVGELLGDQQKVDAMATSARQLAIQRYHPLEVAREHLRIYREVASTRS